MEYVVLYDYIKNELCVNKDKPDLECNGKCHLKKELAKAAETQDKNTTHNFSVESNIVFVQNFIDFNWNFYQEKTVFKNHFYYNNLYQHSFCSVLFKPPVYLS